ncbi:MAG TPA: MFS transporter [Candidatus Sulfotelmatobacter sp.]|nr:MFS transporter [Candidatus Sulfotelmatobacter sp.]
MRLSAAASAGAHAESRTRWLPGNFRWVICAVLFFGISKNYVDRQVLGVLKVTLQHDLGWNEIDYSNLVFVFQGAYALGMLVTGHFIDRVGTRLGYGMAMVFWSVASMAHALCGSLLSFEIARGALGVGESGAFPASIKTVTEWFPRNERALATGIFNAGTNVGAIITPLVVPWITIHLGWRWAFLITGGVGFVWFLIWMAVYRKPEEHAQCTAAELNYIRSDGEKPMARVPWTRLLGYRQTWGFLLGKFLTDPIWWFYLFWVPGFFQEQHGLNLMQIGLPIVVIYLISDVGSVVGGWLSSRFIQRGYTVNMGRKLAMLLCAVCVVPIVYAYRAQGLWTATLLIGLAAAAHQGFSANLYTTASDMFPSHAVASVVGIGGAAGAIGGMFIASIVGHILQATGSYFIPFVIAGAAYLLALGVMQMIVPKLEPVQFV